MKQTNVGDLLRNMHRIRRDLDKVKAELKHRVVEAAAGGGLVKVMVNGQQEVVKISIDPQAASPAAGGVEMLEDLLVAALSQGIERSKTLKSEEVQKITGDVGLNFADLL